MRETFLQLCIYLTIGMILFCLVFSVIAGIIVASGGHIFSAEEIGDDTKINTADKNTAFQGITEQDLQTSLFISVGIGSIIGIGIGGAVSWLTKTTSGLAVGMFSGVFWSAYLNTSSIINQGGWLTDAGFMVVIHVIVAFLFIGAIIGMFSGSG